MTPHKAPDAPPASAPLHPPRQPGPLGPASTGGESAFETYQHVAETVAGPSFRLSDNLIQGVVVIAATAIGALIGYLSRGYIGALIGGAGMMILSTLFTGIVLMVLGWVRVARRKRRN